VSEFSLDLLEPIERVRMQRDDDLIFLSADEFAVE
jgi:hypothetical protein